MNDRMKTIKSWIEMIGLLIILSPLIIYWVIKENPFKPSDD